MKRADASLPLEGRVPPEGRWGALAVERELLCVGTAEVTPPDRASPGHPPLKEEEDVGAKAPLQNQYGSRHGANRTTMAARTK